MVSALKSFQIYSNLFLAVHIANVSGFRDVIAYAVIPILQRENYLLFFSLMLIWKIGIRLMSETHVHVTFIIYRGSSFYPLCITSLVYFEIS